MGEEQRCLLDLHAAAQIFIAEVLIPGNLDLHYFVPFAGSDLINDSRHVLFIIALSSQAHFGFEIPS